MPDSQLPASAHAQSASAPSATSVRQRAWLALLLLAPAPSVGVIIGFVFGEGTIGAVLWFIAKVWLFGLPLFWHLVIDRRPLSFSPPRAGGFLVAVISGVAISAVIFGLYLWIGRQAIDPVLLRKTIEPFGLTRPAVYFGAALYWILINSVLEEYVYRWFFFRKLEEAINARAAIFGSAAIFVVHHAIAMNAYFPLWLTALGSFGIFVGGSLWSYLYLRYGSIWIPYVCHAIVDIAIFAIGAVILFGPV